MKSLKSKIIMCALGVTMTIPAVVLGCSSSMLTTDETDGITYRCVLVRQSASYCYYDCYPVN